MNRYATLMAAGMAATLAAPALSETIVMQSIYPSTLPLLGETGAELPGRVSLLTGGELEIEFNEPGAIVPGNEIWDAVSTGAVDAGWYSSGFADAIIPSAAIFTAVPFGPDIRELSAWWYHGGGAEIWEEISEPFNIHSELCAILVPEASGWFREPIDSPEQLKGLKMRIYGLGAQVMQKLGVEAQSLPVADTMTSLRLGNIDAAEVSFPLIDLQLGMNEHANNYYFPGWHQQTSLITFIINKDVWNGLSDQHRAVIEDVCTANVTRTMALGEAAQLEPLAELEEKGVVVHKWSPEMIETFRGAWEEVLAEKSAEDADFKRAYESLAAFREKFAKWSDLGYLK